jgi:hypothetical protein
VNGIREVEVKYRVLDPDHLTTALPALGLHLSDPVHQDDQAYAERGWTYGMSKIGVAFARLRTEAGRHLFTLKKPVDNALGVRLFRSDFDHHSMSHNDDRAPKSREIVAVGDHRIATPLISVALSSFSGRFHDDKATLIYDARRCAHWRSSGAANDGQMTAQSHSDLTRKEPHPRARGVRAFVAGRPPYPLVTERLAADERPQERIAAIDDQVLCSR